MIWSNQTRPNVHVGHTWPNQSQCPCWAIPDPTNVHVGHTRPNRSRPDVHVGCSQPDLERIRQDQTRCPCWPYPTRPDPTNSDKDQTWCPCQTYLTKPNRMKRPQFASTTNREAIYPFIHPLSNKLNSYYYVCTLSEWGQKTSRWRHRRRNAVKKKYTEK